MYEEQRATVDLMRQNTNAKKKSATASDCSSQSQKSPTAANSKSQIGNNSMMQVGFSIIFVRIFFIQIFFLRSRSRENIRSYRRGMIRRVSCLQPRL